MAVASLALGVLVFSSTVLHSNALLMSRKGWPSWIQTFIDWDLTNKLPPWMTSIEEGSPQGVALVFGQSLKPDGTASHLLLDRARKAKALLDEGKVDKVIVSGGDPAGVGHTEAYEFAQVLEGVGIPSDKIIQESQATTTAENVWFSLRWLPQKTGQLYLVTSDFHMPRATYITKATLNYFYKMLEDHFKDDVRWNSTTKKYPRLTLHQAVSTSFCGSNASLAQNNDASADISTKSLALRAQNELMYLGDGEVEKALYGEPLINILYIWPVMINVTQDPENDANYKEAMGQAMNAVQSLCPCVAPPEGQGPELAYPLQLPIPTQMPVPARLWKGITDQCLVQQKKEGFV